MNNIVMDLFYEGNLPRGIAPTDLDEMVEFAENYLRLNHLSDPLEVTIVFDESLNVPGCDEQQAYVLWIDDDPYKPRTYEIETANAVGYVGLARIIFHEFVHIKQYATGRLVDTDSQHIRRWKGKSVDSRNYQTSEEPWEVEAYQLEDEMLAAFLARKSLTSHSRPEILPLLPTRH